MIIIMNVILKSLILCCEDVNNKYVGKAQLECTRPSSGNKIPFMINLQAFLCIYLCVYIRFACKPRGMKLLDKRATVASKRLTRKRKRRWSLPLLLQVSLFLSFTFERWEFPFMKSTRSVCVAEWNSGKESGKEKGRERDEGVEYFSRTCRF